MQMPHVRLGNESHSQIMLFFFFFLTYWGQCNVKTLRDLIEVSGLNIAQISTTDQEPALNTLHDFIQFNSSVFGRVIPGLLMAFRHISQNLRLSFNRWASWALQCPCFQFQAHLFLRHPATFRNTSNYTYCNHIPILCKLIFACCLS